MDIKKIGILEKDNFSISAITKLQNYYDVSFYDKGEDIKTFVRDKYALFVRLSYQIDDQLTNEAYDLNYICSPTTGLNHISVTSPSIRIISLKGEYDFLSTIRATPEHIMGLTFSLIRNYRYAFRNLDNDEWNRDLFRGYEIYNNDIGIIGYGRIGKLLTGFFRSFGAKVHVYDIDDTKYLSSQDSNNLLFHKNIFEVIESSKIIILCVNYEPNNKDMITKEHFKLMEKKYFINAARGELVNEVDLLEFIAEGKYLGVAIDVFANETGKMTTYKKLLELSVGKNVIVTPHIGGATFTSMHRTEEFIVEKLLKIDGLL